MSLEVKEKMPDGYHGIETLFRGLCLRDSLSLRKSGDGIRLTVEWDRGKARSDHGSGQADSSRGAWWYPIAYPTGDSRAEEDLPADESNLAWRAAALLARAFPERVGPVDMRLTKRIPLSAGLGGGSADAAAALIGVNKFYDLGLGMGELRAFAGTLGADVAFCLEPLAAIGKGKGEVILPVEPGPPLWVVIVKPPFGLSAKAVYDAWDQLRLNDLSDACNESCGVLVSVDPNAAPGVYPGARGEKDLNLLLEGMRGGDIELIWKNARNDLEEPAFAADSRLRGYFELVGKAAEALLSKKSDDFKGKRGKAILCGSGSAIAVFVSVEETARALAEAIARIFSGRQEGGVPDLILTRTLTSDDLSRRFFEES